MARLGRVWRARVCHGMVGPEYISPSTLNQVICMAGRLVAMADFRPTYGRFVVTQFEILK